VWIVTAARVYYLAPGGATYSYDQSSGLARGWATWTDTWFSPGTYPVTFASVAGGASGEAVIGNIGAIADRIQVNPANGVVIRIDNMSVHVDPADPESEEQQRRVVASLRTVADLNGTFNGTAYLGGFHGFYAFHGLTSDCQCQVFQQHNHAFADWAPGGIGGGDVRALGFSPDGDVWQGDRDVLALWPQRSLGSRADFFQSSSAAIDVFPAVRDEIWGLGVDGSNGVYVASHGQGLAYVAPATHALSYWTRATTLPQNRLTDVTVDRAGEVWVTTLEGGVARYNPASGGWSYYTSASGLAENHVRRVYSDKYGAARKLYFATANGVTVFAP
jgi:ligand-binding sensor domain-containing protein